MSDIIQYLMIAFDVDKPMDPLNAKRKFISKSNFELLTSGIAIDIDMEEIPYSVVGVRHFTVNTMMYGSIFFVCIDVKSSKVS